MAPHWSPRKTWAGLAGGVVCAAAAGWATAAWLEISPSWPVALVAALLWLATAILFHYSSLAALVAAAAGAMLAPIMADRTTAAVIAGIAMLIILRHHANIRRLISGTESRISLKKS